MAQQHTQGQPATLAQKARHEFVEMLGVCGSLYICFAAVLLLKSAILHGVSVQYEPYGLAAIKALILGKFILLGQMAKLGETSVSDRLVLRILYKSFLFLLLLLAMTVVEHLIVGLIHHQTVGEVIADLAGKDALLVFATSLMILLILIPYIAFKEIDRAMGHGRLTAMLFSRQTGAV